MFSALLLQQTPAFSARVTTVDDSLLSEGDVTVDVSYSTLNFKDGLAITNRSPVVRRWPMIPGIDGAGVVVHSSHTRWAVGDEVLLNGFGVGEVHSGCLAQRARLKGDWLIARPTGLSARQAMAIGTAGYTAMLCVLALEQRGISSQAGEILVTGATGGVGSFAVALLSRLGYDVVAATGKLDDESYLKRLGARTVMDRKELSQPGKPLQRERWAGVVDVAGGTILANALAQSRYGGVVTSCGLAQAADLPTSVMPFILRGVALQGIDSVMASIATRELAWSRLARDVDTNQLEDIGLEIPLGGAVEKAHALMEGQIRGRVIVRTSEA